MFEDMRMQADPTTMEDSVAASRKTKHTLITWSNNYALQYLLKEIKKCLYIHF